MKKALLLLSITLLGLAHTPWAQTWNGSANTDWGNANNWDGAAVPTSTSAAVVPMGKPRYPILSTDVSVGALHIEGGANVDMGFDAGYYTTLTINTSLVCDGVLKGSPFSSIMFSSSASDPSTLGFDPGSGDFPYATLSNLALNGTGGVSLGTNLTVGTDVTFAGSGKLYLHGQSLTLNGSITNTVSEGISGSATSSLVLGNSATQMFAQMLSMDQTNPGTTNQLLNITFNNLAFIAIVDALSMAPGGTTMLAGSLTIYNNSNLTMAGGANMVRSGAGTFNAAPTFTGPVNLTYTNTADITTGGELPPGIVNLNNLTLSNAGAVTLDPNGSGFGNNYADAYVNGQLLQAGTGIFDLQGNSLTIVGGFTKTGAGTITASNAGCEVVFANSVNMALPANTFTDGAGAGISYLTMNGGGGITLSDNISISSTISFLNGIITATSPGSLVTFQWDALATATRDGSHVDGYVNKLASSFDGPFTYPVGDATRYQPIIINISFVANNDFGLVARYMAGTPGQYSPDGTLNNVNSAEYWDVAPINQTMGAGIATLFWDDYNNAGINNQADMDSLKVAKLIDGNWVSAGRSNDGAPYGSVGGDINSNSMNTWVALTLGTTSSSTILPVTLAHFSATGSGCLASLTWETASEVKSSYYAIEASTDAINFAQVAKVASTNKATGSSYKYGYALANGTTYFRLKAVDVDGKYSYSNIVPASGTGACGTGAAVTISPNPTSNTATITGLDGSRNRISTFDIHGKKMGTVLATGTSRSIDLSTYASGIYLLQIESPSGKLTTLKVVKQ